VLIEVVRVALVFVVEKLYVWSHESYFHSDSNGEVVLNKYNDSIVFLSHSAGAYMGLTIYKCGTTSFY
jgi:hypothetical protein